MPRNRVQHQKGLSDDAFEQHYPDEEACQKAWFRAGLRASSVRDVQRQTIVRYGIVNCFSAGDAGTRHR